MVLVYICGEVIEATTRSRIDVYGEGEVIAFPSEDAFRKVFPESPQFDERGFAMFRRQKGE